MIDLFSLKAELDLDPNGYGYGSSDAVDADLLNLVRLDVIVNRAEIPTSEIREAVVAADWGALSASQRDVMVFHTTGDMVNPNAVNVRAAFLDAFPGGSTTRANLGALQTRQGSRSEQLFGLDVRVTPSDVADARRL